MSKYTTGELAKLCGVSVRTVQYYDNRNILTPSELSEGGRRLYSEDDLKKMRVICFLKELGFSLNAIGELFSEKDPGSVIALLLDQQEQLLRTELAGYQEKLRKLEELRQQIKNAKSFSVDSLGDIAEQMKNKKKLFRVRSTMIAVALIAEAIEVGTILLWIFKGIWWPFAVGLPILIGLCTWISVYYFHSVAFICPQCHEVFKPKFKESFWAYHTPTTRRLTCPKCGHKGMCVETYGKDI